MPDAPDIRRSRTRIKSVSHSTETLYPEFDPTAEEMVHMGSMSHTITPYDVYARVYERRVQVMLRRHRIDGVTYVCNRRILGARGSGPGGMQRLGDDWSPPEIVVIVARGKELDVLRAWHEFNERQTMIKPFLVVGGRYWDRSASDSKWHKGSWWAVIDNAIHIAQQLKLPPKRIKALRAYRIRKAKQPHTNYSKGPKTKHNICN